MDPITAAGGFAAVIIAVLYSRMKRGDIWKNEAEAEKARADRLEGDVTSLRTEVANLVSRISILEGLVTQRAPVEELGKRMDANHIQVMAALAAKNGVSYER